MKPVRIFINTEAHLGRVAIEVHITGPSGGGMNVYCAHVLEEAVKEAVQNYRKRIAKTRAQRVRQRAAKERRNSDGDLLTPAKQKS